jgi:hypothetical protein
MQVHNAESECGLEAPGALTNSLDFNFETGDPIPTALFFDN